MSAETSDAIDQCGTGIVVDCGRFNTVLHLDIASVDAIRVL
jgi:hypothetical protein